MPKTYKLYTKDNKGIPQLSKFIEGEQKVYGDHFVALLNEKGGYVFIGSRFWSDLVGTNFFHDGIRFRKQKSLK